MLHICIILNGPPGVGKDTLAGIFEDYGFQHRRFKDRLYTDTAEYFDQDLYEFTRAAQDREKKELPYKDTGMSPREMLIHVSETIAKPMFGPDYFGKAAAIECMMADMPLVVFSDGGFGPEVDVLRDTFNHTFVIRLHREGYTFKGDSRDYIEGWGETGVYDMNIVEGKPYDTVHEILDLIDPYMDDLVETFGPLTKAS